MDTFPVGITLAEFVLAENPTVVIAMDIKTTNTFKINVFFPFPNIV
jgi:hypothetical protein